MQHILADKGTLTVLKLQDCIKNVTMYFKYGAVIIIIKGCIKRCNEHDITQLLKYKMLCSPTATAVDSSTGNNGKLWMQKRLELHNRPYVCEKENCSDNNNNAQKYLKQKGLKYKYFLYFNTKNSSCFVMHYYYAVSSSIFVIVAMVTVCMLGCCCC